MLLRRYHDEVNSVKETEVKEDIKTTPVKEQNKTTSQKNTKTKQGEK